MVIGKELFRTDECLLIGLSVIVVSIGRLVSIIKLGGRLSTDITCKQPRRPVIGTPL